MQKASRASETPLWGSFHCCHTKDHRLRRDMRGLFGAGQAGAGLWCFVYSQPDLKGLQPYPAPSPKMCHTTGNEEGTKEGDQGRCPQRTGCILLKSMPEEIHVLGA
jgi:hypothetical protein